MPAVLFFAASAFKYSQGQQRVRNEEWAKSGLAPTEAGVAVQIRCCTISSTRGAFNMCNAIAGIETPVLRQSSQRGTPIQTLCVSHCVSLWAAGQQAHGSFVPCLLPAVFPCPLPGACTGGALGVRTTTVDSVQCHPRPTSVRCKQEGGGGGGGS